MTEISFPKFSTFFPTPSKWKAEQMTTIFQLLSSKVERVFFPSPPLPTPTPSTSKQSPGHLEEGKEKALYVPERAGVPFWGWGWGCRSLNSFGFWPRNLDTD